MAPNLNHAFIYVTTGTSITKSIGAYYGLPLRFGKLVLTASDVVLENKGYYLLIITHFLKEFNLIVNYQEIFVSLLFYRVPLAPDILCFTKGLLKRHNCLLKHPTHILYLYCFITQSEFHLPLIAVLSEEGMSIYHLEISFIPAKPQVPLGAGIRLTIPKWHVVTITSDNNPSPQEPLVCPRILNPAYSKDLTLLV